MSAYETYKALNGNYRSFDSSKKKKSDSELSAYESYKRLRDQRETEARAAAGRINSAGDDLKDILSLADGNSHYLSASQKDSYDKKVNGYLSDIGKLEKMYTVNRGSFSDDEYSSMIKSLGEQKEYFNSVLTALNGLYDVSSNYADEDQYNAEMVFPHKYSGKSYEEIQKALAEASADPERSAEATWLKSYGEKYGYTDEDYYNAAVADKGSIDTKIKSLQEEQNSIAQRMAGYTRGGLQYTEAYKNDKARSEEITQEISDLEGGYERMQNARRQYERENVYELQYADLAENEDFGTVSQQREFANPDAAQFDEWYSRQSSGLTTKYDQEGNAHYVDVYGDVFDENYDAKYKPNVTDKLGLFLSSSDEDREKVLSSTSLENDLYLQLLNEGRLGSWDQLKEEEINTYYYLLNSEGQESAYRFLDEMQTELNRRTTLADQKEIEAAGVGAQIFYNAVSVPANVFGGVAGFVDDSLNVIQGKEVNPYSMAHGLSNFASAVRQDTAQDIANAANFEIFGQNVPAFLYETVMSMADSALGAATLGSGYTVFMGMNAATNEAKRLYEQGASNGQIVAGSLLAGIAEAAAEKIPLDNLLSGKSITAPKELVKEVLKQAGIEASEEALTEVSNTVTNSLVMGANSDLSNAIADYMEQGMTEEEARTQAFIDKVTDVGWAALGGALSGAGMGGAVSGANYAAQNYNTGAAVNSIDGAGELVAQTVLENKGDYSSKLYKLAQKQASAKNKNSLAYNARLGKLVNQSRQSLINGESAAATKTNIANRLQELGVSQAETAAGAIFKSIVGENVSLAESELLIENEAVKTVLAEAKYELDNGLASPYRNAAAQLAAAATGDAEQVASLQGKKQGILNATVQGKAVRLNPEQVVASVDDGKVKLNTSDGVAAMEEAEIARDIQVIIEKGVRNGMTAEEINGMVAGYDSTRDAEYYAAGYTEAFNGARIGKSRGMVVDGSIADFDISYDVAHAAFDAGSARRNAYIEQKATAFDEAVAKEKARNGQERYSESTNRFIRDADYDQHIDHWNSLKEHSYVKVGSIEQNSPLNVVGIPAGNLYFDVAKIKAAMEKHNDHLSEDILKQIPNLLANPIAIVEYKAGENTNTVNVYGELYYKSIPITVGVVATLGRTGNVISKIRTVHARSNFAKQITDDSILYLGENKKETDKWFQAQGQRVPMRGTKYGFIRSIAQNTQNVKAEDIPQDGKIRAREGVVRVKARMTAERRVMVSFAKLMAKNTGVDIVLYDGRAPKYADKNGVYRHYRADGHVEIWINADSGGSGQLMLSTMAHELTHFMEEKAPREFEIYKNFLMEQAGENKFNELVQQKVKRGMGESKAIGEVVAELSEDMLNDGSAIKKLVETDLTTAQKIKKWIDDFLQKLLKAFEGYHGRHYELIQEAKVDIEAMQKLFNDALAEAVENYNAEQSQGTGKTEKSDAERYSIAYTVDNAPVVMVQDNILDGVPKSQWIKTVKDTIRNRFTSGIPISGRLIKVNKTTVDEYTNSKITQAYKRSSRVLYKDKLRAANNLDEIVLASTNYINEDLKHTRKDNFKEFARGDVLLRIGGNDYSAKVIIGFTSGGNMVLYDVIDFVPDNFSIKKTGTHTVQSQEVKNGSKGVPVNDNVPQNGTVVNSNSTQVDEKYSSMDNQNFAPDKYYERQIDKLEILNENSYIKVGTIAEKSPLNSVGIPAGNLYFDVSKIKAAMEKHEDHLSIDVMKKIPQLLNNPIAIVEYKAGESTNTVSVYGDLYYKHYPITVGVVISLGRSGNVVAKVRTVHMIGDLSRQITDDSVLYLGENKKETDRWFQAQGHRVPMRGTKYGFIRSIAQNTQNVKAEDIPQDGKIRAREGVVRVKARMTAERRVMVSFAKLMAKNTGVDIVLYDGRAPKYADKNGVYRHYRADGHVEIWINADSGGSGQLMLSTMAHELTHFMEEKAPREFEIYKNFLMEQVGENKFNELVQQKVKRGMSESKAIGEVVAELSEDMLNDGSAIKKLAETDLTTAQKIKKWIDDFLQKLLKAFEEYHGRHYELIQEAKVDIEAMQKLFNDALAEAVENYNAEQSQGTGKTEKADAERYSIAYTVDNAPVVVVRDNILDGVPKSQWIKTVKDTIKDRFSSGIPVGGRLVKVNKITGNEYTGSKNTQSYKKYERTVYRDKFKAANNLDEIILASTNYINEDLNHNRKDNFKEFARGDVLLRIGGNDYSAKVIIGFTSGGNMVLYDVIDFMPSNFSIKKVETHTVQSPKVKNSRTSVSTNDNVPQNGTVVNSNSTQVDEKYSSIDEPYSYDALIAKGDMAITKLNKVDPATMQSFRESRESFSKEMMRIAKRVQNPSNTETATYLYCKDLDKDIMVGRKSFGHGAARIDETYAAVCMKLADIIENSVAFNELTPREKTDGSIVLLGMAETDTDYVCVRTIVNKVKGDLVSYDIVYSVKKAAIKKEDAGVKPADYRQETGSTTSSKISIRNFFEIVKQEKLPNSVFSTDVIDRLGVSRLVDENITPSLKFSTAVLTRREILSDAFTELAENAKEAESLAQYREAITKIEETEEKLARVKAKLKERSFAPGKRDQAAIDDLIAQRDGLQRLIDRWDKRLLQVEAAQPLKELFNRATAQASKRARAEGREALRENRESRSKTALRGRIRKELRELDKLLNRGTKERNVKTELRDTVATALAAGDILFNDTVSNEDIVRAGVRAVTDEERKQLKRYAFLLAENDSTEDAARIEKNKQQMYRLNKLLAGVFERERNRYTEEKVGNLLGELASAYHALSDSKNGYISLSYDQMAYDRLIGLKEKIGGVAVRNMTVEQLRELSDAFTIVLHTVRNSNKLFREGKQAELEETAGKVLTEIGSIAKKERQDSTVFLHEAKNGAKNLMWQNFKPVYAFEKIGSKALMELYWDAVGAEGAYYRDIRDAGDFINEQKARYHYKDWDKKTATSFVLADGKHFDLTVPQMMSVYAYSKREQAQQHMMEGGFVFGNDQYYKKIGSAKKKDPKELFSMVHDTTTTYRMTPQVIAEIINTLTEEQRAYVDGMQGYLSTVMGAKGNEVSRKMYGIDLFKEEHYFPLRSERDFISSVDEALQKTPTQASLKGAGMAKETAPNANNAIVLQGFDDVWIGHVDRMSQYHALVLPIENLMKVFNYKGWDDRGNAVSVKNTLSRTFGDAAQTYLDGYITDLNGGVMDRSYKPTMKWFSRMKKAAVGLSASTVVQQPTAIIRAWSMIDPKYFVPFYQGQKAKTVNVGGLYQEMLDYAPIAGIKDMGGFDTGSTRQAKDYIGVTEYGDSWLKGMITDKDYRNKKLDDAFMIGATKADQLGWVSIWSAVKKEIADQGSYAVGSREYLEACGKRFTEVIVYTQVYDSVNSRSSLMRSKSDFNKAATAFMGEPTTSINMLYHALLQIARAPKGQRAKIVASSARMIATVFSATVAASAMAAAVYAMRDEDEEKEYGEKYLEHLRDKVLSEIFILNWIPYVNDIVSLFEGWDVERPDMSLLSDVIEAGKRLASDTVPTEKKIKEFAWAFAALFGLPLKNLMKDAEGLWRTVRIAVTGPTKTVANFTGTGTVAENKAYVNTLIEDATVKALADIEEKVTEGRVSYKTDREKLAAAEKTAKTNVKAAFTRKYKEEYFRAFQAGDTAKCAEIGKILRNTGLYENVTETLAEWRADWKKVE